ncbi:MULTISPECIES: OmpP1/FadL family transporter [Burkholderia cepacia complex]|uniref:OmpP1/FadL family transporter n=1 Tax=Burkholderia cepacia complex TaxID=87882 RepID=UPI000B6DEBCF|nr:outer membrane protein transport protein [Burkholderia metallica]OUE42589.1 hypothetical protein BZY94_20970 [Burkholderia territorii]HDR9501105.1 outer membrane protein transport protein [Burkholderia cepacia]
MRWKKRILAFSISLHATSAWCINGAEMSGHGATLGMGGVTIANPEDSLVGASNPAGMAFVGNKWDLDLAVFDGSSTSTYLLPSNVIHQRILTAVPNFGFNYQFAQRWSVGISSIAGGAGVNYDTAAFPLPGAPRAKNAIAAARIVNSWTYKPTDDLSLGVGLVLGYQNVKTEGLILPQSNGALAIAPSHGFAQAFGYGASAGVLWRANDWLTLGASYMSKTHMGRPHGYSQDLLGSVGGHMDLPESFGVGFAVHPTSTVTIAGDWKQIRWADSRAFKELFGWKNQNVVRGGVSWQATPLLTLRAGVSRASELIGTDDVARNVYGPGINTLAYTVGASYDWKDVGRFSFAFEYDPQKKLVGTGLSTGSSIDVHLHVLSLSYQRSF